jgi:hypothetical protein
VQKHYFPSVADPVSGAFLTPDPGSAFLTMSSRMGKKARSRSGMNTEDYISESLETIFWIKILKLFDAGGIRDPESRWPWMEKIRIQDPK